MWNPPYWKNRGQEWSSLHGLHLQVLLMVLKGKLLAISKNMPVLEGAVPLGSARLLGPWCQNNRNPTIKDMVNSAHIIRYINSEPSPSITGTSQQLQQQPSYLMWHFRLQQHLTTPWIIPALLPGVLTVVLKHGDPQALSPSGFSWKLFIYGPYYLSQGDTPVFPCSWDTWELLKLQLSITTSFTMAPDLAKIVFLPGSSDLVIPHLCSLP